MNFWFPYGALLASAAYGLFVFLLQNNIIGEDGPICVNEPCRSEGMDNSIVNWGSDFYLAGWSILLGLHHLRSSTHVSKPGYTTLICMGIGYFLVGLANREFSNNGRGDGKGMRAFFVTWPISFFLLTVAVYEFSSFTRRAWQQLHGQRHPKMCGIFEIIIFETLVIVCFLCIVAGSIWSLATDDVVVNNDVDEISSDPAFIDPPSVQMVFYGSLAWAATHTLFFIACAAVLGTLAIDNRMMVWGLPNTYAAVGMIAMQTISGSFWVAMQAIEGERGLRDADRTFVNVIFHYGMVMTTLFIHNFIGTIQVSKRRQSARSVSSSRDNDKDLHDEETPQVVIDEIDKLERGQSVNGLSEAADRKETASVESIDMSTDELTSSSGGSTGSSGSSEREEVDMARSDDLSDDSTTSSEEVDEESAIYSLPSDSSTLSAGALQVGSDITSDPGSDRGEAGGDFHTSHVAWQWIGAEDPVVLKPEFQSPVEQMFGWGSSRVGRSDRNKRKHKVHNVEAVDMGYEIEGGFDSFVSDDNSDEEEYVFEHANDGKTTKSESMDIQLTESKEKRSQFSSILQTMSSFSFSKSFSAADERRDDVSRPTESDTIDVVRVHPVIMGHI